MTFLCAVRGLHGHTPQELHAATADLLPVPHGTTSDVLTIRATGSSQKRSGPWQVPLRVESWAEHSCVELGLVEAVVRSPEIHVDVQAMFSAVVMVVAAWSIDLDVVLVDYGTVRNDATTPRGGAARSHITGHVQTRQYRRPACARTAPGGPDA